MFSHVMLGVNDMDASVKFYDATLGALGAEPGKIDAQGRAIYSFNGGLLLLSKPINGAPACGANGGTVGFSAKSAEEANAWHAAGVANGGTAIEDAPGIRGEGTPMKMYLAYLRDPSGNKLCALKMGG